MLALYRIQKSRTHQVKVILNMCDADTDFSRSHGISQDLVARQAEALGIELLQPKTDRAGWLICTRTIFRMRMGRGI